MKEEHPIAYRSTLCGESQALTGQELFYYGFSYVVPADKAATDERRLIGREVSAKLERYLNGKEWVGGGEVLPGGIIERVETVDIETGDYLVTYRIPFRASGPAPRGLPVAS